MKRKRGKVIKSLEFDDFVFGAQNVEPWDRPVTGVHGFRGPRRLWVVEEREVEEDGYWETWDEWDYFDWGAEERASEENE